jgi:hypothetical protein
LTDRPADEQDEPKNGVPSVLRNKEPTTDGKSDGAKKTKHTWLEKSAVAIAILAFLAAAWQGYVANDTEKRTLRAYILFESGKVEAGQLTIKIKNSGTTPAYSVVCKLSDDWNGAKGWPKFYDCPRRRVKKEEPQYWTHSKDIGGQSD